MCSSAGSRPNRCSLCRLPYPSSCPPHRELLMPHPSAILRLVGFAVAAGLAMAAVQPVLAATAGAVHIRWALGLTAPGLIVAGPVFGVARIAPPRDGVQPAWDSVWLPLPGSF